MGPRTNTGNIVLHSGSQSESIHLQTEKLFTNINLHDTRTSPPLNRGWNRQIKSGRSCGGCYVNYLITPRHTASYVASAVYTVPGLLRFQLIKLIYAKAIKLRYIGVGDLKGTLFTFHISSIPGRQFSKIHRIFTKHTYNTSSSSSSKGFSEPSTTTGVAAEY